MKKIENNFTVSGFVGKGCRNPSVRKRQRSTLLIGSRPSGEERRGNQPRIGFHEYGGMAQERAHRIIRQAHQGRCSPSRVSSSQRWTDKGWREALQNHHGCNQVLRVSRQEETPGKSRPNQQPRKARNSLSLHNKATFGSLLFCSGDINLLL